MTHTAKGYALAHGLSLHQVFVKAWRETYDQTPNFKLIQTDTDRYMNYGAVPPYVMQFLKDKPIERWRFSSTPYYTQMA